MLASEARVKRLDSQRVGVLREPLGGHERDRSEPTDVSIMQRPSVVQPKLDRRVAALALREIAAIDQQGPP